MTMPDARRLLPAAVAAALIGVAALTVCGDTFVESDTLATLNWGRQVVHGHTPTFSLPGNSTPHPLTTLIGIPAAALGHGAGTVAVIALSLFAYGVSVVGTYLAGERLFGAPVGVVAGLVVVTSPVFFFRGVTAGKDVLFTALIAAALAVEARRPLAGRPTFLLLLICGLLRPEAWLFSGAYWLATVYAAPGAERARTAVRMAGYVIAAPLIWVAIDLVTTGDPLFSLVHTREGAEQLQRITGLSEAPGQARAFTRELLGSWAPYVAAVGAVLAMIFSPRRALLPIATAGVSGMNFLALAVAHLSLLSRYFMVPGMVGAIFMGYALLGWTSIEPGTRQIAWIAGAAVMALVLAVTVPGRLDALRAQRGIVTTTASLVDDLEQLAAVPQVHRLVARCDPVLGRDYRLRGLAAWTFDIDQARITQVSAHTDRGLFVTVTEPGPRLYYFPKRTENTAPAPSGFQTGPAKGDWRMSFKGC
jgi:hypothetical protein